MPRGAHPVDSGAHAGQTLLARADVEKLLRGVGLLVIVGALLAGLTGLAAGDRSAMISALAALSFAPLMFWLVRTGRLGVATAGCSVLLLAIAVFVTVTGSGTRDVGMNVFAVAIICSGLLLRRRAAFVMMGLTVVAGGMIGVAEMAGWLHHPWAASTTVDRVADIVVLQGSVAALVALLSRTLYRSLERTLATERSYSQIFDAAHDAIVVSDADSRQIVNVNESALETFNRTREQMIGATIGTLLARVDDETRRRVERAEADVRTSDQRFEVSVERADGARGDLEVSMQRATVGDRDRIVTVVRDISERRAIEKGLLEGEKLRVVGQLARGVAHDFNNQLTGILGSTTFLEKPLEGDIVAREHLDVIKQSARRSAELVNQLLAFARKGKRRSDAVDCNQLIEEVDQLLRRSLDKRIEIVVQKSSERVETVGDATLLQNALLNLALNARDAMPGGGRLTLSAGLVTIDDAGREGLPAELPNGRYACLAVVDTGPGMDEGTLAHIFEPFFTTKEAGNGMGLAAVYGTMQSHGGATRVESKPGRGTRFELLLPAIAPGDLAERPPVVAALQPRAVATPPVDLDGMRVLVVDDEPLVRQTTGLLLERLGCQVQEVSAGESALKMYRAAGPRHDLIILDHDMPGLSGSDTAKELRRLDVKVPILIVSGYGGEVVPESQDLVQGFLGKPFSPEQLAEAAAAAIQRGRA